MSLSANRDGITNRRALLAAWKHCSLFFVLRSSLNTTNSKLFLRLAARQLLADSCFNSTFRYRYNNSERCVGRMILG